ncbi:MAG: hypothetical protein CL840_03400 [Crocinitomicaceae bacterium]|nr:hypothetical protein [Crocinitomicaceae bacterium]|tara:strand:- start:333674 stop:334018 length:345 start_codon:yes stop_codon:yes gene_type:complete
MPFTADTLNRLKPVEIDGITILTDNEHKVAEKGHIHALFMWKEPGLLPLLKENGYTLANYNLRADYESGKYGNWALLDKDNKPVLQRACDDYLYAFNSISSYAVKHYGYKPESS